MDLPNSTLVLVLGIFIVDILLVLRFCRIDSWYHSRGIVRQSQTYVPGKS